MTARRCATLIVGGGPAGTAVLIAAARAGRLGTLAAHGLAVVERGGALGGGRLGGYGITSDSTADTFLSAMRGIDHPAVAALADHPAVAAIGAHRGTRGVPLAEVGAFLDVLGGALGDMLREAGGALIAGHEAVSATRTPGGEWRVRLRALADGGERSVTAGRLVIAAGGHQPLSRLERERVAGDLLVARCGDRLVQSDALFSAGGMAMLAARLGRRPRPRILVVGGSTSAVTAANKILADSGLPLGPGALTIAHRRPLRLFYPSAEAARAEGYDDFTAADICPLSGFVYRLAGLRLDARELIVRAFGIGGRTPDPRLALHRIDAQAPQATLNLIDEADLVVAALGYRPVGLPLHEVGGAPIPLAGMAQPYRRFVDDQCRVVDAAGVPVPGVFAIGLAAGFVPHGPLGGEASFAGQANGLWLWQNAVGAMIVDQLLDGEAPARAVA